jgi:CubicO group peptidase (beta-lactamase class C family)
MERLTRPTHVDVLDEMFSRPSAEGTSLAFVALRAGEFVVERYGRRPANAFEPAADITADTTLTSWSMAKSITHAAIGLLVTDGLVDLDAPAPVPEWAGTDKEPITVLQLLEMRSGLRFAEDYVDGDASHCIEMLFGGVDPSFAHYAAVLPLDHAPGTEFNYSSGTTNILARIVGDAVAGTGTDPTARRHAVTDFLRTRLFGPTGMASATPKFDDAGDFVGSSFVDATARDFARFGELYLHDGVTARGQGTRILPVGWRDHARTRSAHDPDTGFDYGRHFWLWPGFPGSLACHGYEGQYMLVLPDRDLVLVHLGKTDVAHSRGLHLRLARLAELL